MRTAAENRACFRKGFTDAIPIMLGYFAVSFTLGIAAFDAGLTWFEAGLMSALNYTSAGQAAAITIIRDNGGYAELVLSQVVINLRYLLMSAALTVKLCSDAKNGERMLMGVGITDEIFAISSAQGRLNPNYTIGALAAAGPGWIAGTALGAAVGNILPGSIVSALSLALYAMFIAIIIPPARKNPVVALLIAVSMLFSAVFSRIGFLSGISSGMKVIILTVVIASVAAALFPVKEDGV